MDSSLMKLCRQLHSLSKLFRFVELCILLAFLSWLSSRLPFAVRISGEYCRKLVSLILCPVSIFLLGNAIVVTLLAKSGLFTGDCSSSIDNAVAALYDELRSEESDVTPALHKEEIVFQDKQIICEETIKPAVSEDVRVDAKEQVEDAVVSDEKEKEVKASYRRCQSENLKEESKEKPLRRSETEICWRSLSGGEELTAEGAADDGMSSEEFRRTIEEFIAKQVSFHREERLSVVLRGQA